MQLTDLQTDCFCYIAQLGSASVTPAKDIEALMFFSIYFTDDSLSCFLLLLSYTKGGVCCMFIPGCHHGQKARPGPHV